MALQEVLLLYSGDFSAVVERVLVVAVVVAIGVGGEELLVLVYVILARRRSQIAVEARGGTEHIAASTARKKSCSCLLYHSFSYCLFNYYLC